MAKVSIIIPVYNVSQYIERCLQSVEAQTLTELEVLLIDNCGTDDSIAKAQAFVAESKRADISWRFAATHTNNGPSAARNLGLQLATGEYVTFLDADDLLDSKFVEKMLDCATREGADFVACNALRRVSGEDKGTIYTNGAETLLEKDDCLHIKDYKFMAFFDTCWAKLFRKDFLCKNNITFIHGMTFGEDTLFTNTALLKSVKTAVMGDYIGYVYTEGQASASKVIDVEGRLRNLRCYIEEFAKQVPDEGRGLLCRKCLEYVWTIKKHGGQKRKVLLKELLASDLWKEIIFPVVVKYGKFKHRLVARLLDMGGIWAICQW